MPAYTARPVDEWRPGNEAIVETLVIAFAVIVADKLGYRASEVLRSDRNHPIETFFFDRSDEPFRMLDHEAERISQTSRKDVG